MVFCDLLGHFAIHVKGYSVYFHDNKWLNFSSFAVFLFVSLLQTMRRHRNEVTVELRKVRKDSTSVHTHTPPSQSIINLSQILDQWSWTC